MFKTKRAYDKPSRDDGFRVLVERLWPRGVTKRRAALDLWMKDLAPSPQLRQWFGHDPRKWAVFRKRYQAELKDKATEVKELRDRGQKGDVTLVYGSKDQEHNAAVALKELLEKRKGR